MRPSAVDVPLTLQYRTLSMRQVPWFGYQNSTGRRDSAI